MIEILIKQDIQYYKSTTPLKYNDYIEFVLKESKQKDNIKEDII